ncbi:MAG: ATP-binding protein [Bacillota bacterium]|nr:ATP-binding protein [Bacillota bacterium]
MDTAKVLSALTLINDRVYLPIVLEYLKGISLQLGFDQKARQHIEIAVEEAVFNVIEHAFSPGEKSSYNIQCLQTAMGMEIRIA